MNNTNVYIDPFTPPNDIRLVDVQPQQVTFNWTAVDMLCQMVVYKIFSFNCGRCPPESASTSVTCTDVIASGRVCTFNVQPVVCGNITGNLSNPVSVILKGMSCKL